MSCLGPSQYIKVISPENSKKSQTHFSILSTEYQKKQNQQVNLGLPPNVPVSFNDIPRDSNCDVFFESSPF